VNDVVDGTPPRASLRPEDPEYEPHSHAFKVYFDGVPVSPDSVGLFVQRYDCVEGWIEGRPRTDDGHPDKTRTERRYGVVTVQHD
jgi:hypothetical protein